jgi:hypothetical protein
MRTVARHRTLLLLALALLGSLPLFAQRQAPSLRLSPLRVFDPFGPSIDAGLEVPVHSHHSLLLDLGYISTWGGRWYYADPRQGLRVRTAWRRYRNNLPPYGSRHFWELESHLVRWNSAREVVRCQSDCQYFEDLPYTYQALHLGFLGRYGFSLLVGKRLRIEVAPGAGFQTFRRSAPALRNIPANQLRFPRRVFRIPLDEWLFSPVLSLGFSVSLHTAEPPSRFSPSNY